MTTIKKSLYLIECITNLHVGSGDSDFGLIDNRVQRDVITNFPTINSSSLKGAFAIHFDKEHDIFGKGNDGTNPISGQGKYKFFPANLLATPMRSMEEPYYLVTCEEIIESYNEIASLFGGKEISKEAIISNKKVELEGIEIESKKTKFDDKKELIVIDNKTFKELVENLPVIARNHLENGESQNLWYEEIVPRKSLFYFGIDKGMENSDLEKIFDEKIDFNNNKGNLVHIGGNVTVGYGACKITKLGDK